MTRRLAAVAAAALALLPAPALAHGDLAQLATRAGAYQVDVFSSPSSLTSGALDLSVVVLDAASHQPVRTAAIQIAAQARNHPEDARTFQAHLEPGSAVPHYVATVLLPDPGVWQAKLHIAGPLGPAEADLSVDAARVSVYSRVSSFLTLAAPLAIMLWIGFRRFAARRPQNSPP